VSFPHSGARRLKGCAVAAASSMRRAHAIHGCCVRGLPVSQAGPVLRFWGPWARLKKDPQYKYENSIFKDPYYK